MKWQSQLFYCQFLLLPYLDVTPVSQQRASPIRAGPLCTKRHTFWLMAFLVDRNQICVSKCHKQISEIFQKSNGHYGAVLLHKTPAFPNACITIALMPLEQYCKLFAESEQRISVPSMEQNTVFRLNLLFVYCALPHIQWAVADEG